MNEENKHIILINGIPTTVDLTYVEPILNENKRLLKMNDNWYVVDKVFYDYVDKYKIVLDKIKEYVNKEISLIDKDLSECELTYSEKYNFENTKNKYINILELLEEIE